MPPACPLFCWTPAGSWLHPGPSSDLQPSASGSATGPWAGWAASSQDQRWGSACRSTAHPSFETEMKHTVIVHFRGSTDGAGRLTQNSGWVHLTPQICQSHRLCASRLQKCWKSAIYFLDISLQNLVLPLPLLSHWVSGEVNYQQCTISKHFLLRGKV